MGWGEKIFCNAGEKEGGGGGESDTSHQNKVIYIVHRL